jgi:hypothetical protein
MPVETIVALIGNLAIAVSVIVALVFGVAQTRAAARDRKERLTLETLRLFQTREFAETIYRIRDITPARSQVEFQAMSAEDQIMLMQFGQQMESLGMLVFEKYIDLDLVDKTLGTFVSTTWEKYKLMFEDMREKLPDPYLGEYYQWLAERVEERISEGRQPYYLRDKKSTR